MFIFSLHLSEKEFYFFITAVWGFFSLLSALNKLKYGDDGKTSKNLNAFDDEADFMALQKSFQVEESN